MNILSLHCSHHGAVSVASDGKLIVHCELSRLNKQKYFPFPDYNLIKKIDSLGLEYDVVLFSMLSDNCFSLYHKHLLKRLHIKSNATIYVKTDHHLFHAFCAKSFRKKFDNYFIWDGNGATLNINGENGTEIYSLWDNKLNLKKRFLYSPSCVDYEDEKNYLSFKNIGIGEGYTALCRELGLFEEDSFSEGKAMALSTYGKYDLDLHKKIFNGNEGFNRNNINVYAIEKEYGDVKKYTTFKKYNTDKENIESQNFAHTFQKGIEKLGLKIIQDLNIKGSICFSGGVTQNVLLNTFLTKNLNQPLEFDPICNDQGISLGNLNCFLNGNLERNSICYLGFKPDYEDLCIFNKQFKIEEASVIEAALLVRENPLALFQGRSEQGQRGLGNRSLLMNATHLNCINKVNKVKNREWYRPFSCSILHEELENYFVVDNNRNPEFMMHVFNARFFKKKDLQNVLAKDGTCRLQSVTRSKNNHLHELLRYCSKNFGYPFLLNTSLNLPGRPIVEDLYDLREMMLNSDLKYAWLPDIQKIITKNEK
jgi:predicted NodU family carbamoyl transferase